MTVMLASKTIAKINEMLEADQGASFRGWLGKVIGHIGDAYRTEEDGFRSHMGASIIGKECGREIWYGFRWTRKPKFPARIVRLFNRGHLEEARFIALLLMIGCQVYQQDENGKQFRISHAGGHFGGSGDGIATGIPDVEVDQPVQCEFKTHGDKSFKELKEKGLRDAKFEHFVQMNCYMYKMGIPIGFYLAVNKNDDDLYGEIIYLNQEIALEFLARGEQLVFTNKPPARISNTPGFFKCRFCDLKATCHLKEPFEMNCRTCAHSTPFQDGTWKCTFTGHELTKDAQLIGCENYVPLDMHA